MNEVVDGGDLIMLVIINALLCKIWLVAELLEHFQNLGLSRYVVFSDDQALVFADGLMNLEPPMLSDICSVISGLRVSVKYLPKKIRGFVRNELGQTKVTLQNLLVQLGSVRVFKRQVPADHGIKDNTTTPNIYL